MKGGYEWKTRKIMSALPKSTWKYSHWLIIEPEAENENPVCISWDHVDPWRELSNRSKWSRTCSFAPIWTRTNKRGDWCKEKRNRKYGNSWSKWMCVPDIHQKYISTKWVIMEKFKDKRKIMKARSNLLQLQCTCCTVPTTSGRPHGSPLVWACQWPSSQPLSSPHLSHNDSLWA